jgi:transcriptional regulator with XRE-family HTH domain
MGQNGNGEEDGRRCKEDKTEKKLRRDLGRRTAKARMEQNLSQLKLAQRLGIGRSRLSKWELGLHAPLLKQLVALAQALSLSLDELIIGHPPAPRNGGASMEPATRETLNGMADALKELLDANRRKAP